MTKLTGLISHLDEFLSPSQFSDPSLNGLQVEGRGKVDTIVTGVSASARLFDEACRSNADAVIVHHGLFWGHPLPVVGPLAKRLKLLLDHDISLLAYHLPLDAHEEVGNNAVIASGFGLVDIEPWGLYRGKAIGRAGRLETPIDAGLFEKRANTFFGREVTIVGERPEHIEIVAVCSGSSGSLVDQAVTLGADVLITGEPGEPAQELALEAGMMVVGAGHYTTEMFGVRALGEHLSGALDVNVDFVDVPNPI